MSHQALTKQKRRPVGRRLFDQIVSSTSLLASSSKVHT